MGKTIVPARVSVKALIYVDDVPVAGQVDAVLNRSMSAIDITNQIKADWKRHLAGVKQWNLTCSGLVVADEAGYLALEKAFLDGTTVTIQIREGEESIVKGNALITSFPVDLKYNQEYVYNVSFLGTGALQ